MSERAASSPWPPCDAIHLSGSSSLPVRCDRPALHAENGDPEHGSSIVNKRRVPEWRTTQKPDSGPPA